MSIFDMYRTKKKKEVDPNAPPRPNLLNHEKRLKDNKEKYREEESNILLFSKPKEYTLIVIVLEKELKHLTSPGHTLFCINDGCGKQLYYENSPYNPHACYVSAICLKDGVRVLTKEQYIKEYGHRKHIESVKMPLTETEHQGIEKYVKEQIDSQTPYNFVTNNCIYFVNDCLKILDLEIKDLFSEEQLNETNVTEDFIRIIYPQITNKYHNIYSPAGM